MSKIKIRQEWMSLSEETNALDYLEQAYHYIQQTEKRVIAWKWVILTLHGALYGFAICALKGTNPDNVTFEIKEGEKRLIGFDEALRRCQDSKWMRMTVTSKHLQLTNQQKKSIEILRKWFRNNFEHYIPKRWIIEILGMPQIAIDILGVIRFLALDTGNYVNLDQEQKERVKLMVFQSKRTLEQSQLYKEYKLAQGKRQR